jgi:hypothetical protein
MMALGLRYEHGALNRELASEKDWLQSVVSKLEKKAASMSEVGKYRLMKSIEWHITPVLSEQENLKRDEL